MAKRLSPIQKRWVTKLGLALAVSLLVVVLTEEDILKLGIIERMELASIDYRFQARGTRPFIGDTSTIVIVEISEESFRSLPEKWPWPRSYYARLIRNLHAAGARVVGLDLIFTGDDIYSSRNDDELRAAIRETDIAVLAGKSEPVDQRLTRVSGVENFGNTFFDADSALGLVNIRNDADGVYRRYSPFFDDTHSGLRVPTFAFAILNKFFDYPALTASENFDDRFLFSDIRIPKYDAGSLLINFYGPAGTFPRVKFADVMDDENFQTVEEADLGTEVNVFSDPEFGYLYDGTFKDKIVLVGSTAPEDRDLFPVSIARGLQKGDNLMYGVEIHANVVESTLRGDFLRRQSTLTGILAVMFFTIVTFITTSALKSSKTRHHYLVELNGFLFATAEVFIIGFASLTLFNTYNYLLTTISPILAVTAGYFASTTYHFVVERKQRMLIKTMFSTYVNPSVVDQLISNPEKLTLGGERKELTVLFSDIEGFTTISERIPPERLVGLLNEYLSEMTRIILQSNGTVDKYEGDAVMAFWGAPVPQEDHALRACLSALTMQETLVDIRTRWRAQDKPLLNVRIGISTGDMVVGNLGSAGKFDYTVIGDSVNLASRLEGANKVYRTRVIASARTYELVKDHIIGRELDLVTVRGRSEPLKIFELLQRRNVVLPPDLNAFIGSYSEGLSLYRSQHWKDATERFMAALKSRPNDYPTILHLDRIRFFEKNPPSTDWNGVFPVTDSSTALSS